MKLDKDTIDLIRRVIETSKFVAIDNIVIETGYVRAIDSARTVFILHDENVPTLPFNAMSLGRVDTFKSRFDVISESPTDSSINITAWRGGDGNIVNKLSLKSPNVKVDYTCADPNTITAPKKMNDTMLHRVNFNSDLFSMIQKGQRSMKSDHISFVCTTNEVTFEVIDINNDVFSYTIAKAATLLTSEATGRFAFKYPIKHVLSLIRNNTSGFFDVGENGILKIPVNDLNVYILQQV